MSNINSFADIFKGDTVILDKDTKIAFFHYDYDAQKIYLDVFFEDNGEIYNLTKPLMLPGSFIFLDKIYEILEDINHHKYPENGKSFDVFGKDTVMFLINNNTIVDFISLEYTYDFVCIKSREKISIIKTDKNDDLIVYDIRSENNFLSTTSLIDVINPFNIFPINKIDELFSFRNLDDDYIKDLFDNDVFIIKPVLYCRNDIRYISFDNNIFNTSPTINNIRNELKFMIKADQEELACQKKQYVYTEKLN